MHRRTDRRTGFPPAAFLSRTDWVSAPAPPRALDGGRPAAVGSGGGLPGHPAARAAAALPLAPGVYRFRDQASRSLYIGRAVSLRRRVQSYWRDLGDRAHLAPMVARIARVEAVPCDSAHEAAWLERNLLRRRLPPWNRSPGGQEAEVWIRRATPRTSRRGPGVSWPWYGVPRPRRGPAWPGASPPCWTGIGPRWPRCARN